MVSKPTLHEIAAMPFPKSEQALEKFYGVKPKRADCGGELKTYSVTLHYSWRERASATYEVEAYSAEEAEERAEDEFDRDNSIEADDPEIDHAEIDEARP